MPINNLNAGTPQVKPTTVATTNTNTDNKADKPKISKDTAVKVAIGAGLAALASLGIYIATRGKGGTKVTEKGAEKTKEAVEQVTQEVTNNSEIEELQKQADELRNKIKDTYAQKKADFLKQYAEDELSLTQRGFFNNSIAKPTGRTHLSGPKDMDKILEEHYNPENKVFGDVVKNKETVSDFNKTVKNKISELSTDKDWIELRNMRRDFMRKKANREKYDHSKLGLIDEVLLSKINGKPTELLENLHLSVDDAVNLIHDKNTSEKLEDKLTSVYGNDLPKVGLPPYKLRLNELFKNFGYSKYAKAKGELKDFQASVDKTLQDKKNIQDNLREISHEIQTSDDVKQLKELNKKIAEKKSAETQQK